MNYHRRLNENGTCDIICTRCFLTLGTVGGISAAREVEANHRCAALPRDGTSAKVVSIADFGSSRREAASKSSVVHCGHSAYRFIPHIPFVFVSVPFFVYILPTIAEFFASRYVNLWFAAILPGDLVGCICLATIFRMRVSGPLLYLALTACEGCMYVFHLVSPSALIWIADLVPTLVIVGLVARGRATVHEDNFASF